MEKNCNRCEKNFNVDTLPKSLIARKLFTRCNDCIRDIAKRRAVKNYLLKKGYNNLTIDKKKFVNNHLEISIPIPKTDNPKSPENMSEVLIIDGKRQCTHCMKFHNPENFYLLTFNNKLSRKCKTCLRSLAKLNTKKYSKNIPGHIYIISNESWKGYYKIGKAVNIENRLNTYQTGSPFRNFKVLFSSKRFQYSTIVEMEIEQAFEKYKVKGGEEYEWYKLNEEQISNIINFIKKLDKDFKL